MRNLSMGLELQSSVPLKTIQTEEVGKEKKEKDKKHKSHFYIIRKTQFNAILHLLLKLCYQISSLIKSSFFLVGLWGRQVNQSSKRQKSTEFIQKTTPRAKQWIFVVGIHWKDILTDDASIFKKMAGQRPLSFWAQVGYSNRQERSFVEVR